MNNKNADFRRACAESQGAVRRHAIGPTSSLADEAGEFFGSAGGAGRAMMVIHASRAEMPGMPIVKLAISIAILIFI
jgi:hypothetical protein